MRKSSILSLGSCSRCPRLFEERERIKKKFPDYCSEPVGQWGDPKATILIIGLAPGLHGAARTGKAFVGDSSGTFLFSALFRNGLSNYSDPSQARLLGVRITNAVKCYPPANKPTGSEVRNCKSFLRRELETYIRIKNRHKRSLVVLGRVAQQATYSALGVKAPSFEHGSSQLVTPKLGVFASYHPSRLNVNTKRLTAEMLDTVLRDAKNFAT